jgi:signal transduction histidine kinase/ActR/RegA family two-component response regulator
VAKIDIARGVHAAQIRALYQHTPMMLTVNMVNSALVSIVLSSYLGQTRWMIFLALTIALTGVRVMGWSCYRRVTRNVEPTTRWAVFATLGSGLSGVLWGVSSALLLPDDLVEQTFVAFVIGGMCAASLVAFSNYLPAFIAYVFPASLPLAARFFLDGWMVHGDMMVVFAAAMTLAACNATRTFTNGLQLNLHLRTRTRELRAANKRLETEISQREAAEDQLRQAQKMEAIGQLTGGIAHDFNNLLTAVVGHLEIAQGRVGNDPRTLGLLQAALRAADRGAALTRQLLAFARRQHLDPRPVDIATALEGVEKILRQTIGPEIELAIEPEAGLHPVWADPNQLELAILNLALNARDAMPTGGRLQIRAEVGASDIANLPVGLPPGNYVTVSVSDTGTGMDGETLARAFEPFFTTKEPGRGSGLGLSLVHGFASQSGGSVRIASSVGNGTAVELWLPHAEGEVTEAGEPEPSHLQPAPRRATILVCDDDSDVLEVVAPILRDSGYTVWEAERPSEALEIVERNQSIDLLLVDYAMPEMSGVAVIDHARTRRPDLKALLMSGHADILYMNGALDVPLLSKPFKLDQLRQRVAEVLSARTFDHELRDTEATLLAISK